MDVYDVYTELIGHSGEITSINYRNNILVSGSKDCSVIVWKCNRNEIMKYRVFNGHTDVVQSVIVSDCGLYVISGSWDTTVRIWNIEDDKCVHVLYGHTKEVLCCSIRMENVVSSSKDGTIKIWDLNSGRLKYTTVENQNEWIDNCQVAPVGYKIVYSTSNGNIGQIDSTCGYLISSDKYLKDTKTLTTRGTHFKLQNPHNHWILSPDNSLLSVGGNSGDLDVYDFTEGRLLLQVSTPDPTPINYLMYSPTRYELITATDDGITFINLETKLRELQIKVPTQEILHQQQDTDQIIFKFKEYINPYNFRYQKENLNENDKDSPPKCLSITWDFSYCLFASYDDNIIRAYSFSSRDNYFQHV